CHSDEPPRGGIRFSFLRGLAYPDAGAPSFMSLSPDAVTRNNPRRVIVPDAIARSNPRRVIPTSRREEESASRFFVDLLVLTRVPHPFVP
ncbi:MAG: hypothetical protein ACYDBL_12665, partial [Candidatus Acidiferrales bacterium]